MYKLYDARYYRNPYYEFLKKVQLSLSLIESRFSQPIKLSVCLYDDDRIIYLPLTNQIICLSV